LAVNPNHVEVNAAAALADPDSVFHHYRRLIELRHTLPVVVDGTYRLLLAAHEQVFAYTRTLDATTLLVVANLSGQPVEVDLGEDAGLVAGEVLVPTHGRTTVAAGPVALAPWESFAVLS
jgi:oligo-1,6-glucosidase